MNALLIYDPISIPIGDGRHKFIDPGTIIYVEAADKYSHIYCVNNVTYKAVSLTLQEVRGRLPRRLFLKVHKSFLVSRIFMTEINKTKTRITCTNNIIINVGRTYLPDFLKRFRM